MKKIHLLIIVLFFQIFGYSQNAQDLIDKLKIELKTKPDAKRIATIYSDLTWYYSNISIDSALVYGDKALQGSIKLKDSTLIAQVYSDIGNVYFKNGDYKQSLERFKSSLSIRKQQNNSTGIAKIYTRFGDLYQMQSKYNLAMNNYLIALKYADKANDDNVKFNIINNLSSLFLYLKDFKRASTYSNQAIEYFEKKNQAGLLCSMYTNKGNILLGLKDTTTAIIFYNKAKIISREKFFILIHLLSFKSFS